MTRIKICGITNLEDALFCTEAGADMLGFIFYPGSKRYIAPEAAAPIIAALPANVTPVGLTVNETSESTHRKANVAGVRTVQLQGNESSTLCKELRDFTIIKCIHVDKFHDLSGISAYDVDAILLDTATPAYGGSGMTFDWTFAKTARPYVRQLFLAGGLNSENVADAITVVQPDAVDLCSGVELKPGKKDHEKVRSFIAAVRAADKTKQVSCV
jgi:phosphoribosylanthranilate isomerase